MRGKTTHDKMLVILVFKRFCEFYSFSMDEQKFENKSLMNSMKVKVAI